MRKVDYTTFNNKTDSAGAFEKRWWLLDEKERPQTIVKIITYLMENDGQRQAQYQTNARLYGNVSLMGVTGFGGPKASQSKGSRDRVTYNVIQSGVDTITAKIAKNKPKSSFLTEGGNWRLQRKAKKLEKFCDGVRYENKGHQMGVAAFRDSGIYGDGLIHVFPYHGRVKWERVLASELLVDPVDAFYGNPRCKYRVKNIDRDVLIDLFPKHEQAILEAPAAKADLTGMLQNVSDQVTVAEAWHLPSGPEAKDGMHVLTLETVELECGEWTKDYFPFGKLPWSKRLEGYWAQGIPEILQGNQLEINKISWLIQRSMHLAGTFKIWLKTGSKLPKEHINNEIGAILESDDMPQYLLPPIVQSETYQRLLTLKQDSFELIGVSMLSAASKKPEGLDSGKALREFNDIESDRFMTVGQEYEQFFLTLDRLSIECAKDIVKATGGFDVKVPGRKFLETISWKDVDLEKDEYLMKAYPVSSLPNEPAGRLQTVQEYVQAGFYTPRTAKRLLDMPDLEQVDDLSDAQENWIHETLEKIVESNDYNPPEPEMDLKLAKELVLEYIAQAHTNDLEPEKIDSLRLFNTQIDALVQKALPPPMPMPMAGAPGAGAAAVPEAPPVSAMLPNAPGSAA